MVLVKKEVSSKDLELLLDYMYTGEIRISQDKLAGFLKTAEYFKVKGFTPPDEGKPYLFNL